MNHLADVNVPKSVSGSDKLKALYEHPGPYVSLYLQTRPLQPGSLDDLHDRWATYRQQLREDGASDEALDAITARLRLPAPPETAGVAVLAASDGATVVEHSADPPAMDVALVDRLPYVAPLLEWHQRRVPHLVVTVDEHGADVATFGLDHFTRLDELTGPPNALVAPLAALVEATAAELVLIAGESFITRRLADELATSVPVTCRVVAEPETGDVADLADAAVRHASDAAARKTVGYLRELRFLAAHHAAVDGTADTVAALRSGAADVLLIHDDPADQRRIWIGDEATEISLESRPGWTGHARLVDAAIRAAIQQDATVHIIPSTGERGPDDNAAALQRKPATAS